MRTKAKFFLETLFLAAAFIIALQAGSLHAEAATMKIKKTSMKVGASKTLTVNKASSNVKWSSSNKNIVKVVSTSGAKKKNARIKALKSGKATIIAKVKKQTLKANVTVLKFMASKKAVSVNENGTVIVTAKNAGANVKWSSNKPSVARIASADGDYNNIATIAGMKQGKATITGKIGTAKITVAVTVKHVHNFNVDATCTTPRKCRCGLTTGSALGHNMSIATCQRPATCSRCGFTSGGLGAHDFDRTTLVCRTPGCRESDLYQIMDFILEDKNNQFQVPEVSLGFNYINHKALHICPTGIARLYPTGSGAAITTELCVWNGASYETRPTGIVLTTNQNTAANAIYFWLPSVTTLQYSVKIEFEVVYDSITYLITVSGDTNRFTYRKIRG